MCGASVAGGNAVRPHLGYMKVLVGGFRPPPHEVRDFLRFAIVLVDQDSCRIHPRCSPTEHHARALAMAGWRKASRMKEARRSRSVGSPAVRSSREHLGGFGLSAARDGRSEEGSTVKR